VRLEIILLNAKKQMEKNVASCLQAFENQCHHIPTTLYLFRLTPPLENSTTPPNILNTRSAWRGNDLPGVLHTRCFLLIHRSGHFLDFGCIASERMPFVGEA
jgi:hypothetical protein